jgi:hypothetical protein
MVLHNPSHFPYVFQKRWDTQFIVPRLRLSLIPCIPVSLDSWMFGRGNQFPVKGRVHLPPVFANQQVSLHYGRKSRFRRGNGNPVGKERRRYSPRFQKCGKTKECFGKDRGTLNPVRKIKHIECPGVAHPEI